MNTRIIVAGSRTFDDFMLLTKTLDSYITASKADKAEIEIICGGASGADSLGKKYANEKGYASRVFLPEWKRYRRGAGDRRNLEMAKYANGAKGVLFAFWDGESSGTKNMISHAASLSLDIHIVKY